MRIACNKCSTRLSSNYIIYFSYTNLYIESLLHDQEFIQEIRVMDLRQYPCCNVYVPMNEISGCANISMYVSQLILNFSHQILEYVNIISLYKWPAAIFFVSLKYFAVSVCRGRANIKLSLSYYSYLNWEMEFPPWWFYLPSFRYIC